MQPDYTTVTKEAQNIMAGMCARKKQKNKKTFVWQKTAIRLIAAMQNKITQGKQN